MSMDAPDTPVIPRDLPARVANYSWDAIAVDLDAQGAAVLPGLFGIEECFAATNLLVDGAARATPSLPEQRAWAEGDSRYFNYPLPELIETLRSTLYPFLTPVANSWHDRMGLAERFPPTFTEFLNVCHRDRQTLPTSIIYDHRVGQQSLLHQDVYGRHQFPLQVLVLLSQPGWDFTGGEFVITEQRPRMQTRPEVVALQKGDAVVFAVSGRPVTGSRGTYRVNLRHGLSQVRHGQQRALSIVFHDASV